MTESASEAPTTPSRRHRGAGLHSTGLVVAVVGLILTVTAFVLTFRATQATEDEQLATTTDLLAAELAPILTSVDGVASELAGAVIATDADPDSVARLLESKLEQDDLLSAITVLLAIEGVGLENYAEGGNSRVLAIEDVGQDEIQARIEALTNAGEELQVVAVDRADNGDLNVGLATKVPTAGGDDWVIFVELSLPPSLFTELTAGQQGDPAFAYYLGEVTEDNLLLESVPPPGDGLRDTRAVAIGDQDGTLVVVANSDLLTRGQQVAPLLVLLAGLALTAVLTPLVGRLASRREEVRSLSAQRDELDDALAISRQIEDELRASEQRFRSVLQSSPDIVLRMDIDGTAVTVLNRDEFLGKPIAQIETTDDLRGLAHPEDTEIIDTGLHRLRATERGSITEYECRMQDNDGAYEWLRFRSGRVEVADSDETYLLAVLTNITEQKQEEARRSELEQQLVQSQRLEAVGQLAGGVAHDFNNILAAIVSGAELVLDDVDGQAHDDVEEIRRTARRGSDLARQLLLFSRRDRGSAPEVVDLNDIVRDVQTMLGRALDESVELQTDLTDDLHRVHIDPTQIERILMNLTINARDAMPAGGIVTISTANVEPDDVSLTTVSEVEDVPHVLLEVSDTGVGMADDVKQKAFEPFFSTKEVGKGTGLGLATVYGIVQGAQGHIEIDSVVGRGTTFRILLPQTRLDKARVASTDHGDALEGGDERILLVEDEEAVRTATRRLLEKRGYHVTVAEDGPAAGSAAATTEFDLLLTDVLMPGGMNGRDVAQVLLKWQPQLAVLYMTGHSDDVLENIGIDDDEEEALIVRKPFGEDELLRAVRVALARVMEPAK